MSAAPPDPLAAALEAALRGDGARAWRLARGADGAPPARDEQLVTSWEARELLLELRARDELTVDDVDRAAAGLDLDHAPDLRRGVERLRAALTSGAALKDLATDPSLEPRLLLGLELLLRRAPAQLAAELRADLLETLRENGPERLEETVVALEAELPVVARLEAPFLRTVRDLARDFTWREHGVLICLALVACRWAATVRLALEGGL